MGKVEKECEMCHKVFAFYPSTAKGRFCSKSCSSKFRLQYWNPMKDPVIAKKNATNRIGIKIHQVTKRSPMTLEQRQKQSARIRSAWEQGKFANRNNAPIIKAMIDGRSSEHGKKISKAVKQRYALDTEKKYGFRASQHLFCSEKTKAKLSAISLRQWQNMTEKQQIEKIAKLRKGFHDKVGTMFKIINYDEKTFFHPNEIKCYEFLLSMGLRRELIIVNFPLGLKNIDFFVNNAFFWEHHVCNAFDDLSKEEYFKKRRQILDNSGYEKYPLIVTVSNDELKDDLKTQMLKFIGKEKQP